jgi:tetratricopeptide (TPR) repeat protein
MFRRLTSNAAIAALMVVTPLGAGAATSATPERIEPMRKHMLTEERYHELRKEWLAYTEANPKDPVGWTQLAKAANYAGDSCSTVIGYAEKAVRLAPDNAEALATLGGWKWSMWCDGQPTEPDTAIALLERALKLDPSLDDPHVRLWVMRLAKGQKQAADAEMRALLDGGRLSEPLVDFGYNLLVGLEPNAILLTNGDNDTCPAVALQAARGFRTDVTVINLSLLNLVWYRRQLRAAPASVPVPLLETTPYMGSTKAVAGLIESLAKQGWKRPLYTACTVNHMAHPIPNQLSLEGVVYRVTAKKGTAMEVDTVRCTRNLDGVYRLESATTPALDWEAWSSIRQLMLNYCAADFQLASAIAKGGDLPRARALIQRALTLSEYHHSPFSRDIVDTWDNWDSGPEVAQWKKKLGM